MTTKLDIEGIRERHEAVDTLAYMSDFDLNVNLRDACIDRGKLLTEVLRLRGDLENIKRELIARSTLLPDSKTIRNIIAIVEQAK